MRGQRALTPHQSLTCAVAMYIGKAAPYAAHDGLDAIQKPLAQLYFKGDKEARVQDHNCTAYVFSSGILMRPVNKLDKEIWFRIQDLESCAAVKAYADPYNHGKLMFVPTDSEAGASTPHPSIFAIVMRRKGQGLDISDCHAFVCKSDDAAMALVNATAYAFSNRCGWTEEKPTLIELGLEKPDIKIDNECYVDDVREDCGPEYYEKPSLKGFFYAPRSDLIQKYDVGGEDEFGNAAQDPRNQIQRFTEPEPKSSCCHQSSCCCQSNQMQQQMMVPQLYPGPCYEMGACAVRKEAAPNNYCTERGAQSESAYMRRLPQEHVMVERHIVQQQPAVDYGQSMMGPPGEENIYSRHLPVDGRRFDRNFIIKKAY